MNKSQRSLYNDPKLREEMALKICAIINKNLPDGKKYTEEEIKNWVNDQKRFELSKKAYQTKLDRVTQSDLVKDVKPDSNIVVTNKQNRCIYYKYDISNTPEAKENNQKLADMIHTTEGNIKASNDALFEGLMDIDPSIFTFTDDEDAVNKYIQYKDKFETCFNGEFLAGYIKGENKELAEMWQNNKLLYEGSATYVKAKEVGNPFYMLIPRKEGLNYLEIAYTNVTEVNELIANEFSDVIEIDPPGQGEELVNFDKHVSAMGINEEVFSKAEISKIMLDKKEFTKDFIYNKHFERGKKTIDTREVQTEIEKKGLTELPSDVSIVDNDPKKFLLIEENNKRIAFTYEMKELEKFPLMFNKYKSFKDVDPIYSEKINELTTKYEQIKAEMTGLNSEEKNAKVNEFKEKNAEDLKLVNDFVKEYIKDVPEYEREYKAIEADAKKLFEQTKKEYSKLSGTELANKAIVSMSKITGLDGRSDEEYFPEEAHKLLNIKAKNNPYVKSVLNSYVKPLDVNQLNDNMAMIAAINEADEKYQHRGWFGKRWYRKSHNSQQQAKEGLINELEKRGMNRDDLNNLGKSKDGFEITGAILNSVAVQDKALKEYIKNVEKAYDEYEKQPVDKLKELDKQKVELNIQIEKDVAQVNKMKGEYLKQVNPDMTLDSYSKLKQSRSPEDIELINRINADLKKVMKEAPNKNQYEEIHTREKENKVALENLNKEISNRSNQYQHGVLYEDKSDISKQIMNDLNKNNPVINSNKQEKVIEEPIRVKNK